jgi:hypothetical protein
MPDGYTKPYQSAKPGPGRRGAKMGPPFPEGNALAGACGCKTSRPHRAIAGRRGPVAGWPGRESDGRGMGQMPQIAQIAQDSGRNPGHAGPDLGRFGSLIIPAASRLGSPVPLKVGRERVGLGDFRVRALLARPAGPGGGTRNHDPRRFRGFGRNRELPFPGLESLRRPRRCCYRCGQKQESGSRGRRRRIFRQCVRQRPPGRFQVHSILASRKLRPSQAGYGRSRTSRSSNQREWALNRAEEATNLLYAEVFRFCFPEASIFKVRSCLSPLCDGRVVSTV